MIYLIGGTTWRCLGANIWDDSEKITSSSNSFLTASFTMKEIHIAVFSMGDDKSSSLDVFFMSFYQTYWDIIKSDLFSMFEDFF
jgi:hypothetical protein